MHHVVADRSTVKGWSVGPWDSNVPVAVGYANQGVDVKHYHAQMFEVYLVAQGESTVVVDDAELLLRAGDVLVVEPHEVHTFTWSTPDYFHFVVQAPFVTGDKVTLPAQTGETHAGER